MKRILILTLFAGVVLFSAYVGVTVYDDHMTVGRMWETPAIRPHEKPISPMVKDVVPFSGGDAVLRATPAEQLTPPYGKADNKTLAAGKTLYGYYCVHCHGSDYDGQGTVGQSFEPLPTDLRSSAVQTLSAGTLFHRVSYGVEKGRQPPLHTTISVRDRWCIVSFIQSMGIRKNP